MSNAVITIAPMDYKIRLAKAADVSALPEIERAAAGQFAPYLEWLKISSDILEGLASLSFLLRAQAGGLLWVADVAKVPEETAASRPEQAVEKKVVGFIVAKDLAEGCFIIELDVHPDYGRRGIGSALVEACCQAARTRGFEQVLLTTFRQVPWNIPFYRRLGFEILPAEAWSQEIEAIVRHEARYGFAPEKRAVMRRKMPHDQDFGFLVSNS